MKVWKIVLLAILSTAIYAKQHPLLSSIYAKDIHISSYQVSKSDNLNNIVTINFEILESNLEHKTVSFTISNKINNLEFIYYNTTLKQNVELSIKTVIIDSTVSTQSEIHPKKNTLLQVKLYSLILLSLALLIIFIKTKQPKFMVMSIVTFTITILFFIPFKEICIKKGAKVFLLPTKNSTIIKSIDTKFNTTKLGKYRDYSKIEYNNEFIGWIKNEDVCNN